MFTSQLEKSRDSVSVSNIRAAYAEAASSYLTANGKAVAEVGNVTVAAVDNNAQAVTVKNVKLKGQASGWSGVDSELSFTKTGMTDDVGGVPGTYTATFTFATADGACTLTKLERTGD